MGNTLTDRIKIVRHALEKNVANVAKFVLLFYVTGE